MTYPENIFCPVCKNTIKLGYETGQNAHTLDILVFRVDIPLVENLLMILEETSRE